MVSIGGNNYAKHAVWVMLEVMFQEELPLVTSTDTILLPKRLSQTKVSWKSNLGIQKKSVKGTTRTLQLLLKMRKSFGHAELIFVLVIIDSIAT